MNAKQLKKHVETFEAAYHKNNRIWAELRVLHLALKNSEIPVTWEILELIQAASQGVGDIGLEIAEFLDAYHFGETK